MSTPPLLYHPQEGRTEGRKEGILRKEGRNDVKGYGRKGRKEGKDPPHTHTHTRVRVREYPCIQIYTGIFIYVYYTYR